MTGGFLFSGYEFQFRMEITGSCRLRKWVPQCTLDDDKSEGECPTNPKCIAFAACDSDWFAYNSMGMQTEYSGIYTIPNGASNGSVTGLGLGFVPTGIELSIISPTVDSEVLTINGYGNLSPDGFNFIMSGATDGPCYKISYTLKM